MSRITYQLPLLVGFTLAALPLFISRIYAQTESVVCEIFPFLKGIKLFGGICNINQNLVETGLSGLLQTVINLFRYASSLIFVFIIAIAVVIIIKSALKYIVSEGDNTKIQEANRAIKSVFMGIAALIIGIVGIILLLVLFRSSGALSPDLPDIFEQLQG